MEVLSTYIMIQFIFKTDNRIKTNKTNADNGTSGICVNVFSKPFHSYLSKLFSITTDFMSDLNREQEGGK